MKLKKIFKGVLVGALSLQINSIGNLSGKSPEYDNTTANAWIQAKVEPAKILENYFTSRGFLNDNIEIPELGVEVALHKNQFYKKEENVVDVLERINEINREFGLFIPPPGKIDTYGWCGKITAECSEEKAFGYIVLIKANLNDPSNIYTTGHENGHFLWYIAEQELIYQKFKNPDIVKSGVNDTSPFAILCGWIAMKKAGYNLDDCFIINSKNPEVEKKSDFIKNLVRDYLQDKK